MSPQLHELPFGIIRHIITELGRQVNMVPTLRAVCRVFRAALPWMVRSRIVSADTYPFMCTHPVIYISGRDDVPVLNDMYPFASGVTITDRYDYTNYAEIAAMPYLKSAQLQANGHVAEMFAFIRAATQLTSLHIADYPERQLKRLNNCTQLTKLTLSQSVWLDDCAGISAIKGLKSLELSVCPRYADICRHVTPNLHTLRLVGHSVVNLDRLNLPNLHILRLNRCRTCDISPISEMPVLIELDIRCCPYVRDLTPINGTNIRKFTLILTPYQPLVNIRVLNMQLTRESNIAERIYKFQIEQINT
jgi:hypothetical protein